MHLVYLIGTDSENGRFSWLGICVWQTPRCQKQQVLHGRKACSASALKGRRLTDFWEILVYSCSQTKQIFSLYYGRLSQYKYVLKHETRVRVFQLDNGSLFHQKESTCFHEKSYVWLGSAFLSLRSLPFLELSRFQLQIKHTHFFLCSCFYILGKHCPHWKIHSNKGHMIELNDLNLVWWPRDKKCSCIYSRAFESIGNTSKFDFRKVS